MKYLFSGCFKTDSYTLYDVHHRQSLYIQISWHNNEYWNVDLIVPLVGTYLGVWFLDEPLTANIAFALLIANIMEPI